MERQGSGKIIWPYAEREGCWHSGQHLEPSPWLQPVADAIGADAEAVVVVEVGLVGQGKAHSAIFIVNPTTAAKNAFRNCIQNLCAKNSAPATKPGISELENIRFRIVHVTPIPPSPVFPLWQTAVSYFWTQFKTSSLKKAILCCGWMQSRRLAIQGWKVWAPAAFCMGPASCTAPERRTWARTEVEPSPHVWHRVRFITCWYMCL